jgi:hypothetical protein
VGTPAQQKYAREAIEECEQALASEQNARTQRKA